MTVSLSIERYWAVCQPTNYRSANLSETQCKRVLKYLVPVILLSVLLNLPKFLETSVQYDPEEEKIHYNVTELRKDPTYIWYTTVMYSFHPLLTTELGPILTLSSLNLFIYSAIRSTKQRFVGHNQGRSGHGELNLASVIIIIVLIFVICHLPRMVLAILAVVKVNEPVTCMEHFHFYHPPPPSLHILPLYTLCTMQSSILSISHLLLLINSSINFLIYCAVATRFRVFMKRFIMCESRELTSNPPFGVTRLVEAPLVLVHAALDNQESINIIRSRLNSRAEGIELKALFKDNNEITTEIFLESFNGQDRPDSDSVFHQSISTGLISLVRRESAELGMQTTNL
ncbi:FMRFamide receptor [Eurytemora carolleeae]|uniref:FMRFamide receptor n=1 Tax=Eurytemora carolleeae TaxID=1294199 RepID=UPI000C761E9F|nr:FMRFamide receptor [Eurytemora carolleeae]|eukprot:XP_023330932.1 FMRFamide receptor-like [Eurytemora affinis]